MVAGGVTLHVCKGGCGGVWFDNFGLKRFLELHGPEGEAALDIEQDGNIKVDHSKKRNCPLNEEQSDYGIEAQMPGI